MSKKKNSITNSKYFWAGIALIIGVGIGWLIKPNQQNIEGTKEAIVKEQIWTCSMHPQIRKNEAGDCPICGMDLIPLENEVAQGNPNAITMSAEAMQLASISTLVVGSTEQLKDIYLSGKVREDERLVYSQTVHVSGRIEALFIDYTGQYVKKGEQIGILYSPELVTSQEELLEAKKIKESQPELYAAAVTRLKNLNLTSAQIQNIETTNKALEKFPILADVSGYVLKKNVSLGDYVQKGQALFKITDLSKVWVLFELYESDLNSVKEKDSIFFSVKSLAGREFKSEVTYVDKVINAKTRVAYARVEIKNTNELLKPEMFVSGLVKSATKATSNQLITIPKTAVLWTGKRSIVYVKSISPVGVEFVLREVTLGVSMGNSFAITKGLALGEEIAINGTFSIDAAAQLAGKPSMMNPTGATMNMGHNHGHINKKESHSEERNLKGVKTILDLQPLLNSYLLFKDALAADNLTLAKKEVAQFSNILMAINTSVFSGESLKTWLVLKDEAKEAITHVPHQKDIEEVRKSFMVLSETMITIVKTFHPNKEKIYVQECTMANNNQGALWLSLNKEIFNPYFGQSMLKCGETLDSI